MCFNIFLVLDAIVLVSHCWLEIKHAVMYDGKLEKMSKCKVLKGNSSRILRNHLRQARVHARCPHQGLDLIAVCRSNRFKWANAPFDGV